MRRPRFTIRSIMIAIAALTVGVVAFPWFCFVLYVALSLSGGFNYRIGRECMFLIYWLQLPYGIDMQNGPVPDPMFGASNFPWLLLSILAGLCLLAIGLARLERRFVTDRRSAKRPTVQADEAE